MNGGSQGGRGQALDDDGALVPRLWVSAETTRNRIIIRTVAGGAEYLANVIDAVGLSEVLGTIAGNDSVAVICSDVSVVSSVLPRLFDAYEESQLRPARLLCG